MPDKTREIALVISDLGSGGAQRVLVQLAETWTRSGRRVTVITLADPECDFFRLSSCVRRISISAIGSSRDPLGGLWANLTRIRRLRKALRSAGAPLAIAFIMPTAVLTLLAARGLRIRVIACERNDPTRQTFGRAWELLRRLTYRWADVVTANSAGALEALARYVPADKLIQVPNPLPRSPQRSERLLSNPTILSIGRLHRQKAHDVLLKAFAIFGATHRDWRLAIMGGGPDEAKLRTLANRLGLADRVDWLGVQSDPFPWLRGARIFSLASRYEGTPNALLEAMCCGLPCIVSDASRGPLEFVKNGVTGVVVPAEDHAALAASIERLAMDLPFSRRLGIAAKKLIERRDPHSALQIWESAIALAIRAGATRL